MALRICCIDGLIGAGKTSVLEILESKGYSVIYENLNTWSPYLEMFHKDKIRWAFALQMNCLNSLDEQVCNIRKTEKKHKGNIVFIERDIVAVSIFTKTAYACKYINDLEYNLFEKYYKYTTGVPDLRFTIDTPISECLKRIKKRKRTGEETIDKSYLHELYNQYRKVESNVFFNGLNCPDHIALDIEDYV